MELANILSQRVQDAACQLGDEYDIVEDAQAYVNLNEPATALEFMADRILEYEVKIST